MDTCPLENNDPREAPAKKGRQGAIHLPHQPP